MYTIAEPDHNLIFNDILMGGIEPSLYPNPQLITEILNSIYSFELVKSVKPTVGVSWYHADDDHPENYQARSVTFEVNTFAITREETVKELAADIANIHGVQYVHPTLICEPANNEAELEYGGNRIKDLLLDELNDELSRFDTRVKGSVKPNTDFSSPDCDDDDVLDARRKFLQDCIIEDLEDMSLPYLEMLHDISSKKVDYYTFFSILKNINFLED